MNTWRGSEEAQPTAAGLVSGYGSRALAGLEGPGVSTPAPQRLILAGGSQSLPFGVNSARQGEDHSLLYTKGTKQREAGRISLAAKLGQDGCHTAPCIPTPASFPCPGPDPLLCSTGGAEHEQPR